MNFQIRHHAADIQPADLADIQPDLLPGRIDYLSSRIRDGFVYLAARDNENVGFLIYSIWWGNTPFIELLTVKPECRRSGAGTALLEAAVRDIKAKGFRDIISSAIAANPLGVQFHEKKGFQKLESLSMPHAQEQFFRLKI